MRLEFEILEMITFTFPKPELGMKIDKNVQCAKCVRRSGAPQKELLCLCPRCMHAHQILQRQHFKNAKPPCLGGYNHFESSILIFSGLQWFHEILKYVNTIFFVKEGWYRNDNATSE